MRFTCFALVVTLLAAPSPGVPQETRAGRPDWRGTGVVVAILPPPSSLHATRPVTIIHHEPIRGLMDEAMDRDLRPGVAFGLKDVPDALLVGPSAAGRPR